MLAKRNRQKLRDRDLRVEFDELSDYEPLEKTSRKRERPISDWRVVWIGRPPKSETKPHVH